MPSRTRFTYASRIKNFFRRLLSIGLVLTALRLTLRLLARLIQRRLNPTLAGPPYCVSEATTKLHDQLTIVDLHADPLLWDTDLSRRNSLGHVDIARLRAGNVALQVFGVVTKVPRPEPAGTFGLGPDLISLLSVIELWPPLAWFDLTQRALYQARKLKQVESRSMGRFTIVTSSQTLTAFLARRADHHRLVAGLLALEGAHALLGSLANLDILYAAGFRMLSLTHLFDNAAGGSSLGRDGRGLTAYGRTLVKRLEERRIIIDLAHASPSLFADVLAISARPPLVSHTGVQGVCPNPRNLDDAQIREIAARRGLIGIGFDALFTCAAGIKPIVDSIRYVADLVGVDHVALGSDFDGVIKPPFDVTGLPLLTEQLLAEGFTEGEIQKIMGANAIRFLTENLP